MAVRRGREDGILNGCCSGSVHASRKQEGSLKFSARTVPEKTPDPFVTDRRTRRENLRVLASVPSARFQHQIPDPFVSTGWCLGAANRWSSADDRSDGLLLMNVADVPECGSRRGKSD
jgi:hypothetical protein